MAIEVSELGPCKRRLSVSIPPEEVKDAVRRAWQNARRQVHIKGFRPGKVPQSVLEKKFGKAVQDDVKQTLINDSFREALTSHQLSPVRMPQIDTEQLTLDEAQPFEFQLEFEIRPDFELPEFRGVEVGAPPLNVTDEDVDRQLEQLRARHAKIEPISEGVAAKGDYLKVELSYQVDGAIVLHRDESVVDTNRDTIDDLPTEGGTAAFAGQAVGATVTVPVHLPQDFEPAGFAGAEAQLLCTVKEIHRVALPEVDAAFAERMGCDDVEDLRGKVRAEVQRHLEGERNRYIEERVFDDLIGRTTFELPEDLLAHATHDEVHRIEHQMMHAGRSEAEAKAEAASLAPRVREGQARALRVSFLVDKIAQQAELRVTDEELEQAVRALAAMHRRGAQEVYDELVESGRLGALRAQILESKVRKELRESAKVIEAVPESSKS